MPVENRRDDEEGEEVPGNELQRVMPIVARPAHVRNRVNALTPPNVLIHRNAPNHAKARSQTTHDLEDADLAVTQATENVRSEIARSESDPKDSDPSREGPMLEGRVMNMTSTLTLMTLMMSMSSMSLAATWCPIAHAKIKMQTTMHRAHGRDEEAAEAGDVDVVATMTSHNRTIRPNRLMTRWLVNRPLMTITRMTLKSKPSDAVVGRERETEMTPIAVRLARTVRQVVTIGPDRVVLAGAETETMIRERRVPGGVPTCPPGLKLSNCWSMPTSRITRNPARAAVAMADVVAADDDVRSWVVSDRSSVQ